MLIFSFVVVAFVAMAWIADINQEHAREETLARLRGIELARQCSAVSLWLAAHASKCQ